MEDCSFKATRDFLGFKVVCGYAAPLQSYHFQVDSDFHVFEFSMIAILNHILTSKLMVLHESNANLH